ncbi:hypothetical protein OG225_32935 [Nocardia sp. NBC_01377]|uniref:hypothetical protein n=1 Tax=Nocardia sp. NBC_01377 TaxID=2903595 RepID=UPI003250EB3C
MIYDLEQRIQVGDVLVRVAMAPRESFQHHGGLDIGCQHGEFDPVPIAKCHLYIDRDRFRADRHTESGRAVESATADIIGHPDTSERDQQIDCQPAEIGILAVPVPFHRLVSESLQSVVEILARRYRQAHAGVGIGSTPDPQRRRRIRVDQ